MRTKVTILVSALFTFVVINALLWSDFSASAQAQATLLRRASKASTIAISNDDRFVVMVNPDDDSISIFSTANDTRTAKLRTGTEPSAVVIHPDSQTAFVANRADATVAKVEGIQGSQPTLSSTIEVGSEPTGLALSPSGATLYVAEWAEGRISVVDTATMTVTATIDNPSNPRGVAVTNNGDANDADEYIIVPEFYGVPIAAAEATDQTRTGLVRVYSTADLAPVNRIEFAPLDSGFVPEGTSAGTVMTSPNQFYTVAVQGGKIYLPSISASPAGPPRFNGNVFPVVYVGDLATFQEDLSNVGTVNLAKKINEVIPANNSRSGRFFLADSVDIDFIGTSNVAYVVSKGGDAVQRVTFDTVQGTTLGSQFNVQIDVNVKPEGDDDLPCQNPTGIVTAHDAPRAYVNCWVTRQLGVIDLSRQVLERTIPASDPPTGLEASINKGQRFYFTGRARWSREAWSSCGSCHPDGLSDNITWSFATGPRQSTSMDGSFSHAPGEQEQRIFNWTGIFEETHDFERNTRDVSGGLGAVTTDGCGDPLEERQLTLAGNLDQPVREVQNTTTPICTKDWDDIEAFVKTIRPPRGLRSLDPASVLRGAALFGIPTSNANNGGCVTCHGGLGWTVSKLTFTPSSETNAALVTQPFEIASTLVPPIFNFHTTQIAPQPAITDTTTGPAEANPVPPKQVACVLRNVSTFGVPGDIATTDALEKKADGTRAQGRGGYNVPSLYGLSLGAPYLHHGQAASLEELFSDPKWAKHLQAGNAVFLTTGDLEQQKRDLISFLLSIDATTQTFDIPLGFDACESQ